MDAWDERACFVLQEKLMEAVESHDSLLSLAGQAFRSSVRAYAAYPSQMKRIFHVKKLHLGHLAYSFCLRYVAALSATSCLRGIDLPGSTSDFFF